MRDTDVLELAEMFSGAGFDAFPFESDGDTVTDVELALDFPSGYSLDQVGSTIESLDELITAGFLAAESLATAIPVVELLERVTARESMSIEWVVEHTEIGSLKIVARIKRAGQWVTTHPAATAWVLGGVAIFAPIIGLSVWVPVAAWAATGAVQAAAAWQNRRLQSSKNAAGPTAPQPEARLTPVG